MFKRLGLIAFSLLIIGACAHSNRHGAPTKDSLIPLTDFFRGPAVADVQVSPDGRHVAYFKTASGRLNLHVRPLVPLGEERRLTDDKDRDLRRFVWKGNDQIVFLRGVGATDNFQVHVADVTSGQVRNLTPQTDIKNDLLNPLEEISRDEILITSNRRNPEVFDVYRLNLATGKATLAVQNPGAVTRWYTDFSGRVRIAVATDKVNTTVYYRDSEGQKFRQLLETDFKNSFQPLAFTPDQRRLMVLSNMGRDRIALVEYDPQTRKETREVFAHPEVDVTGLLVPNGARTPWAAIYTDWKTQLHHLDPEFKTLIEKVSARLPGADATVVSQDRAGERLVIRAASDRNPGEYHLYEKSSDTLTLLERAAPWLEGRQLAEMKPIRYTSRDGLTIHGYLTVPPGRDARSLPVVVNPHGGPWARDIWGYSPEAQFLANRGYAVFQMNFRGSVGYGRDFWMAGFKQWGRKMQDDVTDGVQWLIKEGVADSRRICIYGSSYGGYKTLAGLAFTPDLYRCGVDYVGVSNLFTYLESIPPYWEPYRDMMYEMVGHPIKDKLLLRESSPIYALEKIKAPLLVAQGANDPRVKQKEADQLVETLRKRGLEVPYILKANEGHGFKNEENRMEFYQAMEKFLSKHL